MRAQILRFERALEFAENLLQIREGVYHTDENSDQIVLTNEVRNIVETPEQLTHKQNISGHCQKLYQFGMDNASELF